LHCVIRSDILLYHTTCEEGCVMHRWLSLISLHFTHCVWFLHIFSGWNWPLLLLNRSMHYHSGCAGCIIMLTAGSANQNLTAPV